MGDNTGDQQAARNLAILPPEPEVVASYLKQILETTFGHAHLNVRKALYAIIVGGFEDMDKLASWLAQYIGKMSKVDLAELNRRIGDFPYEDIQEPQESIEEFLARKRTVGNKELTTLAAIVYEMRGKIIDVGREVDGKQTVWFEATVTYNGAEYTGNGITKQLAAASLFNDNEPIRHIPENRSYEEPSANDSDAKQRANLYFQRIAKAVVVNVVAETGGKWKATGRIGDVTAEITGADGQRAAKKKCTYALYNQYKRVKNVPDTEYPYIQGEPNVPGDAMEE